MSAVLDDEVEGEGSELDAELDQIAAEEDEEEAQESADLAPPPPPEVQDLPASPAPEDPKKDVPPPG
jgi:hypothetical protein